MRPVEIAPVPGTGLAEPLALLEESLRDGEPVPATTFIARFRRAVEAGQIEILAASAGDHTVGVIVLAYRLNISAGGLFASIEDLYVRPGARRLGVGRALLQAAEERCAARGISYLEVQVEEGSAEALYTTAGYEVDPGVRVLSRSLPFDRGPAS